MDGTEGPRPGDAASADHVGPPPPPPPGFALDPTLAYGPVPPPPRPPGALLGESAGLRLPQPPPGPSTPMPREDALAIASAALGAASLVMGCCVSFFAVFPGVAALICGIMGLRSTTQRPAAIVGIGLGSMSVLGALAYLALMAVSILAPAVFTGP